MPEYFFSLNLPQYFGWLVFNEQYMGLFLGLALCATFLLVPSSPAAGEIRVPWYDAVASVTGLAIGLYVFIYYPDIVNSLGDIVTERVILGVVTIVLISRSVRAG